MSIAYIIIMSANLTLKNVLVSTMSVSFQALYVTLSLKIKLKWTYVHWFLVCLFRNFLFLVIYLHSIC